MRSPLRSNPSHRNGPTFVTTTPSYWVPPDATKKTMVQYSESSRIDPADPEPLNNLAFLLIRRGDHEAAEPVLRKALSADPQHAAAHYNLGRALRARGEGNKAAEHFNRAAALDPRYGSTETR